MGHFIDYCFKKEITTNKKPKQFKRRKKKIKEMCSTCKPVSLCCPKVNNSSCCELRPAATTTKTITTTTTTCCETVTSCVTCAVPKPKPLYRVVPNYEFRTCNEIIPRSKVIRWNEIRPRTEVRQTFKLERVC
jgi:hypothetical protein